MTDEVEATETRDGVLLPLKVKPRGRQDGVLGVRDGRLLISVTAAPADGAANAAVIEVLADFLNRAKSTLSIARGHKAREKVVLIADADAAAVAKILGCYGARASRPQRGEAPNVQSLRD